MFSGEEECQSARWCIKNSLSTAEIVQLFCDSTMASIGNFIMFITLFKILNEIIYAMGIDFWTSMHVCYNQLADLNDIPDDDYTSFFYRNPDECIPSVMELPAFREHMFYDPETEYDKAEEGINSEVK
jgi:hypothetical protein